ncbi:hypothetical protein [Desulfobacterium sp. N47]|uniref:Uncharacterized protein n=1 Tax=uncultured Desulfobacterium sp. TaxID=201089 RepID=E1YM87_9BACT|nr:unknown protein [uncultured Desulfobacterium sp.]
MLAIKGIYNNGKIDLQEKIKTIKSVPVIVTFLEEIESPVETGLDINSFSFNKSREITKHYHGSLSDAVIEERRHAL